MVVISEAPTLGELIAKEEVWNVAWDVGFGILLLVFWKSQGLLIPYQGPFPHTGPVRAPHPDIRTPLPHSSLSWS